MQQEHTKELLESAGAIIEGHFVGTSGKHLSLYVAKDRATRLTTIASELCLSLAYHYVRRGIEVVVAPAAGGIALAQWTAYHLTLLQPDLPEVIATYSEHDDTVICQYDPNGSNVIPFSKHKLMKLNPGDQVILRKPGFVLKRGFAEDVAGKRVLEIEDVLTTGHSAGLTAKAIVEAGGLLIGLGALAKSEDVVAETVGVPELHALMSVKREIFTEEQCATRGLCARGVPINTRYGHGKDFLTRTQGGM